MSTKRFMTLCAAVILLSAQALALNAVAQEMDPTPDKRPVDTSLPGPASSEMEKNSSGTSEPGSPMDAKPVTAQSFVTHAGTIGAAEVELGQLALKNSQDASVRKFAERMVKDHTAANVKLKTIAARDNLAVPQGLDAEHRAVKEKLATLKGTDFDVAYSAEMAAGHEKAVALFESASQTSSLPPDLKQFAASTLPTLKQHQQMAEALHGKEGA